MEGEEGVSVSILDKSKRVRLKIGKATLPGRFKNESTNEDRLLIMDEEAMEKKGGLEGDQMFVCVDGHGGPAAANYFTKNIVYHTIHSRHYETDPHKAMQSAVKKLDAKFLKLAAQQIPADDSGACILLCLLRNNNFHFAWAGDCRAIIHTPSTKDIVELTTDHQPSNPKEKERLKAAEAPVKNGRVYGILAPSRAFGDLKQKELGAGIITDCDISTYKVDLDDEELKQQQQTNKPSKERTLLLLASDGVWGAMKNSRAIGMVRSAMDSDKDWKKGNHNHTNKESYAVHTLCKRGSTLGGDDTSAIAIFF